MLLAGAMAVVSNAQGQLGFAQNPVSYSGHAAVANGSLIVSASPISPISASVQTILCCAVMKPLCRPE